MAELIYKSEVYAIISAAIEVHRIKALDKLTGREEAQIINYLKAAGYKVGVLINFGSHPKLEWKRFVY